MTLFYLIRHGENDQIRKGIAGRYPGLSLNSRGREQAEALSEELANEGITHLYSSPMERARQTAEPLARRLQVPIKICEALNEVEYGDWTRKSFEELAMLENWQRWNRFRSASRPPGGELILEVQLRVVRQLLAWHDTYTDQRLALFTHGDVIKTAVAHFLGMSLDMILRLDISPASWTILGMDSNTARVFCVNREHDGIVKAPAVQTAKANSPA